MPDVASRAATLVWTPRRMSLSVIRPKKRSTWLTQDDPVGVKWTWKRGVTGEPVVDHVGLVGGVVVADDVDVRSSGTALSMVIKNLRNSTALWRR